MLPREDVSGSHVLARPLRTYETVINLIGNTTNRGGLVVRVRLDRRRYPTGKKISKKELRVTVGSVCLVQQIVQ